MGSKQLKMITWKIIGMSEEYSIALALVDFIPTLLFPMGAYFFQKFFKKHNHVKSQILWIIGGFLVFLGGFLKAIWKLNMAVTENNILFLTDSLFVFQAIGFSCLFVGTLLFIRNNRNLSNKTDISKSAPLTALAVWKIPFLAIQTLTCIGTYGLLIHYSFKKGNKKGSLLLLISVIIIFVMVGLSGSDMGISIQWIAEIINTLGQLSFLLAGITFTKSLE
ncbi:MAG: hypothetical protein ACTSRK_13235 [Promethearchaeota archaeon]